MFTKLDRRQLERRKPERAVLRKDRRNEERRDMPRLRRIAEVFDPSLSRVDKRTVILSSEGASWTAPTAAVGERHRMHVHLGTPVQVELQVIRAHPVSQGMRIDALFVAPDVRFQLALAREIERVSSRGSPVP
jgi:hypothetical protein